jgi:hypothetical protein
MVLQPLKPAESFKTINCWFNKISSQTSWQSATMPSQPFGIEIPDAFANYMKSFIDEIFLVLTACNNRKHNIVSTYEKIKKSFEC